MSRRIVKVKFKKAHKSLWLFLREALMKKKNSRIWTLKTKTENINEQKNIPKNIPIIMCIQSILIEFFKCVTCKLREKETGSSNFSIM